MNELTLVACSIAIPAALPQAQEGGTREPAPDFALADLDGRTH